MSYKVQVMLTSEPGWHGNGLRFATEADASAWAQEIFGRWMLVKMTRVMQVPEPALNEIRDGKLVFINTGERHERSN